MHRCGICGTEVLRAQIVTENGDLVVVVQLPGEGDVQYVAVNLFERDRTSIVIVEFLQSIGEHVDAITRGQVIAEQEAILRMLGAPLGRVLLTQ